MSTRFVFASTAGLWLWTFFVCLLHHHMPAYPAFMFATITAALLLVVVLVVDGLSSHR